MRVLISMLLVVMCGSTGIMIAQTVHTVPFASTGNNIELTIENGSSASVSNVTVAAADVPSWLTLVPAKQTMKQLLPTKSERVLFTFSVDKTAPVGKEQHVTFTISSPSGEQWTRRIAFTVAPPDRFELEQNYPNPFNPTTSIRYELPIEGRIVLKIHDVLGREVETLVDEVKQPGGYDVRWNAAQFPSGVYFVRMTATTETGRSLFQQVQKVILMR